ncbi:MAG: discoidin domain-containing protein [Lentisphaeria bacterium]|nr:discoidin domain-containing protein [Lentisphaeria bacterium]
MPRSGLRSLEAWVSLLLLALGTSPAAALESTAEVPLPVAASSVHSAPYPAEDALDGDRGTRWASRAGGTSPEWLRIDFGRSVRIDRLVLAWERAAALDYDLQVSEDGEDWRTVAQRRDPEGRRASVAADTLVDEVDGLAATGRFLRVLCLRTGVHRLYSIREVEFPDPDPARAVRETMARAEEARRRARVARRQAARRILLEHGVESIVLAAREDGVDGHWYANFGYYAPDPSRPCYRAGGRLAVYDVRDDALRLLVDDPEGSVRDPCVSYDGERVLFSRRRGGSRWFHLYEVPAAGGECRQLTDGNYDDIEPVCLPDGGILFVSSRCRRWVNCWLTQVGVLYRCDGNGGNIRQLSANIEHDNTPWVLPDGRILYQRWEYVDRSQVHYHHLWTANPDGTGQMVYFGNQNPGGVFIDAKPVPDSDEVVLIHSPGHGSREHRGMVALVSPKRGPDHTPSLRDLTTRADYCDPYAIGTSWFLAARGRELVLIPREGEEWSVWELPAAWPGVHLHEPRPLRQRPREPPIPTRVDPAQATGTLILSDVYRGRDMDGVERGSITQLLVLETLPKPINFTGGMEPMSYGGTFTLERIVGTVPVAADGSAHFLLPAKRAFLFVALDRQGRSVKRMQSFTGVMPGEVMGCVGCHEARTEAPGEVPSRRGHALALRQPARLPEPIDGVPEVMDYPRDVQPVLDRHCVRCHRPEKRAGGVLLSGDRGPVYSHSYFTLSARRLVADGRNLPRSGYPARRIGDSASPLLSKMDGTHHGVRVPEPDQRIVRLWVNSGAAWPGTYAALGSGMIGGYAQNHLDRSDRDWPETRAAHEAQNRRCLGCHGAPERPLPDSPSDDLGMPPWAIHYGSPILRYSRHILYNLSDPAHSVLLLAPLAPEAGGYGLCRLPLEAATPSPERPVFADTSDPDYRLLLDGIRAAARHLERIRRFDMDDFRPRPEYIREMIRYGVLPDTPPREAGVDPYVLDDRYWKTLWYRPAPAP